MNDHPKRSAIHLLRALLATTVILGSAAEAGAQASYHLGTTRKLFQITNDWDFALRRTTKTASTTNRALGTDLGSSFLHGGKLWFAFGDTLSGNIVANGDILGSTTAMRIQDMGAIAFKTNANGTLLPITIPGVATGGMCVPSGAVDIGGAIYVVETTAWDGTNMTKSVLAKSTDDGATWTNLYTLSDGSANIANSHFINVSMRIVDAATMPSGTLPWSTGQVLLIWGAGAYRASNLYLAAIPTTSIGTKSAMRYVSAVNPTSNTPTWSTSETSAAPVVSQPNFGEFSSTWIPQQNAWLLMYNSPAFGGASRGIQMRTSPYPWGAWSAPQTVMDPDRDLGYGQYMHISWSGRGHYDKIQDYIIGGDNDWGGEYGGYVVEPFTTGDAVNTQIYWVMSTWNPYQSIMMCSEIGTPVTTAPPADSGTQTLTLGDASWTKSTGTWYGSLTVGGIPGITTWTGSDATTGLMWKALPNDRWNKKLTFNITSGNGEAILIDGTAPIPTTGDVNTIYNNIKNGVYGDVLQATWGHQDNNIVVPITWDLTPYDRANLRVIVIDYSTAGWSFAGISNMTLTRNVPSTGTNVTTIQPGDSSWTKTAGTWYGTWTDTGVNYLTTYGPSGDANVGVMWRMLPRDWKNKTLSFTYHGGHARILLLQGGDPIPTSGNFATIQSDILAGKYGKVLQSIVGPDSNASNIPVMWNLETMKGDDLKVAVIDSLNEPWGFIGFSQMTLTRYN